MTNSTTLEQALVTCAYVSDSNGEVWDTDELISQIREVDEDQLDQQVIADDNSVCAVSADGFRGVLLYKVL